MVQLNTVVAAALLSGAAFAAPTNLEERASCTFSGSSAASNLAKSKTSCSSIVISSAVVPAGTTLDLTGLKTGTTVTFEGTTTFGYKEWEGPLVSVSGTNINVVGASGAVLDGQGSRWWDGEGSNGGKTKPKFFYAHKMLGTSKISNLKIKDSPVQVYSINNSEGLTISGVTIDNANGDSLGHNTDAFDIGSSSSITITGANVHNQDDCVAINSGTDITVSGSTCTGGHGLSIGSVGGRSDNTVKNVTFKNNKVTNSQNGLRIKTVYGATGSVSGVTYSGNTLSGITKYGVVIEQDYENGSPTGKPTSGVPITGLTMTSNTVGVSSSGTNTYILCASGACSNWKWSGNKISGGKTSSKCSGIPSGSGASC